MASELKEWAKDKAPEKVSLTREYARGKAMGLATKAKDASIAANAKSYHDGPAETNKLHQEAHAAHLDAAKAFHEAKETVKAAEHSAEASKHFFQTDKGKAMKEEGDKATAPTREADSKADAARETANKASEKAHASGSADDHKAAAEAHGKAIEAMNHPASSALNEDIRPHKDAKAEHETKAKEGGGGDDRARDDKGRFASK